MKRFLFFLCFSWLAPVLWFLLGYAGKGAWLAALSRAGTRSLGMFAAYLIGLIYLITQAIPAGFYSWFFFAAGIAGLVGGLHSVGLTPQRRASKWSLGHR